MLVHIEGEMHESRWKNGEPYYIIVRDDIKRKKVFCYVNAHRVNTSIRKGELREVIPDWSPKIPWKYYDNEGSICILGESNNDWREWIETKKEKIK